MEEPAYCVLLADESPASLEAVKLLKEAKVRFSIVDSRNDPSCRSAPQLNTPEGIVSHLGFIRAWLSQHQREQHERDRQPNEAMAGK